MPHRSSTRGALLGLSLCVLATACAAASVASPRSTGPAGASATATVDARGEIADWPAVRTAADGQTVRWWLYGGDERVNRYIDEHVVPAAAREGVMLERVPVADTADAVQRVVAEVQAGQADGSVDLIWINGENFAVGKRAASGSRTGPAGCPTPGTSIPPPPTPTSGWRSTGRSHRGAARCSCTRTT